MGRGVWVPAFAASSPLLQQRLLRRGQSEELLGVAAGVGVRGLGGALVGAVDFGAREAAAERQSQQLPVTVLDREHLGRCAAPAESVGVERQQEIANDTEATPGVVP